MGNLKVNVFTKKDYDKALIKYRFATESVSEIAQLVPNMCDDITSIAEIYKKIVTEQMVSDEWIDQAKEIVNIANNSSSMLKNTTISTVQDLKEIMDSIETENRRMKSTIEDKKGEMDGILASLGAITTKTISAPSKPKTTTSEPAPVPPVDSKEGNETSKEENKQPEVIDENPSPVPAVEPEDNKVPQSDGNIDTSKYSGDLHTKSYASDDCKSGAGKITTDNQKYTIVSDPSQNGPGKMSEKDYKYLVAQVAGESGNSTDDMLGVACTILNRLESPDNFGSSVVNVLEKGYWPWGKTCDAYMEGGIYYNTDWGQEKLAQAEAVVQDALNGARNIDSNVYYYAGNGEYNKFSDKV